MKTPTLILAILSLLLITSATFSQETEDEAPARPLVSDPSGKFHVEWKGQEISVVSGDKRTPLPLKLPPDNPRDPDEATTYGSRLLENLPHAFVSPDGNWIFLSRVDINLPFDDLYRRADGEPPRFEFATEESFRALAWRFLTRQLKLPEKRSDQPNWNERLIWSMKFVAWSEDSARLLISLEARLDLNASDESEKTKGVNAWLCYYNLREGKFELTDRLRNFNANAKKRWQAIWNEETLPLSAESIGGEGPWSLPRRRFERADSRLNELYSKLLKATPPDASEGLQQEQREWLIQRDTDAALYSNQTWSPAPKAALLEGKAIATEARVAELEKRRDGERK